MSKKKDLPNILLIMTDQQRYDILSACGGGTCKTPALEKLAEEGVNFSNAYSVCSLCSPARASIFTGRFPHNHGMWNNCDMFFVTKEELPSSEVLLNKYLEDIGYNCGYVGKWHIDAKKSALDHGFEGYSLPGYGKRFISDDYLDYLKSKGLTEPEFKATVNVENKAIAGYLDGETEATVEYFQAEKTIELMNKYSQMQKPFFLTLQFWGPHEVSMPTKEFAEMYPPENIKLWENYYDDLKDKPIQYRRHRDELECWYYGASKLGPEKWKEVTSMYYAYNTLIDSQVMRVLNEIDRLGIGSDLVIIYTTDHGSYSGARGGIFDKGVAMFEDIYHIPFIVRWPGVIKPGKSTQLISNMDVFSTVLDIAGIKPENNIDSRSLVPILKNPNAPWPEDLMCENHGVYYLHSQRMIRWKNFKYIFTPYDTDELYDLENDPNEMKNLINDKKLKDVKRELQSRMLKWGRNSNDPFTKVMEGYFRF